MTDQATNEYPPCGWNELTQYEQNEAITRGFKREPGTLYITKRRYNQDIGELSLVRWVSAPKTSEYFADRRAVAEAAKLAGYVGAPVPLNPHS